MVKQQKSYNKWQKTGTYNQNVRQIDKATTHRINTFWKPPNNHNKSLIKCKQKQEMLEIEIIEMKVVIWHFYAHQMKITSWIWFFLINFKCYMNLIEMFLCEYHIVSLRLWNFWRTKLRSEVWGNWRIGIWFENIITFYIKKLFERTQKFHEYSA